MESRCGVSKDEGLERRTRWVEHLIDRRETVRVKDIRIDFRVEFSVENFLLKTLILIPELPR